MRKALKIFNFQKIPEPTENHNFNFGFHYNYLLGIVMLYMMFMILSGITVYKMVLIASFTVPAGVIVTPFIYSISNIVTEVYGYAVSRNMMWWFIFVSALFTIFGFSLSHLPSPPDFKNQAAYSLILGNMPVIFIAGIIGSISGMSFNNYIVSKYKVIFQGKKYWLRSIFSTAGGEVLYNIIAYPIMFIGHIPFNEMLHIILDVSLFKIIITGIAWPMECFFARTLKIKEKINVIDYNMNYNIFHFKIKKNSSDKPILKIVT